MDFCCSRASKPYKYNKFKQEIIGDHSNKRLSDDIIMSIYFSFVLPVVLYRKKNGKRADDPEAWIFAIDYRK